LLRGEGWCVSKTVSGSVPERVALCLQGVARAVSRSLVSW
jgi:hypothetical protein